MATDGNDSSNNDLLSPTNIATLLILSEQPRHGYEINKVIKTRGMRSWVDMQKSTIYKALDELEGKGYIVGKKEDASTKQSKKVYTINDIGLKVLREQIKLCLTDAPHEKSMFDLGLAGIYHLSREETLRLLRKYRDKIKQGIQFFEDMIKKLRDIDRLSESDPNQIVAGEPASEQRSNPHLAVVKALFDRPCQRVKGELRWLDSFIQEVEEGKTTHAE